MAIQTMGGVKEVAGTPIQCLDCAMFLVKNDKGGSCQTFPEGIPHDKHESLCLQHEYRLRFR